MKKKWMGLVAALVLLFSLAPSTSAAGDPLESAKEKILEGYVAGAESVDISDYNLTKWKLETLYDELYCANRLPWYASNYRYSYSESTGLVQEFFPQYLDENIYDRALYEQKVAEVLAQTVYPGMTQLEIALSVHDYLVANSQYDDSETLYEGYDLLVRGTAVCNGYAEAYMELLKRAGVECNYVISETMDHGWNQVKLGDHWYHVDVTWDDPSPDRQGNVEHTYFLLSDSVIGSLEEPHYGYTALHKSADTTYDGVDFWDDALGQICFESADVYYYHDMVEKTDRICKNENGVETVLYTYDSGVVDGDVIYRYKVRGLSLVGGRLCFCSGSTVYSMNTNGGDLREEHKETTNATYGILGCHLDGNVLQLTTWDLDSNYSYKEVQLSNMIIHAHTYTESRVEGECNQRGGSVFTCDCGVSYKIEEDTAPGHDYVIESQQMRTLTDHGWKTWACARCGDSYTETQYAFLSEEFLSDWDNLRWVLIGGGVLLVLLGKIVKKK